MAPEDCLQTHLYFLSLFSSVLSSPLLLFVSLFSLDHCFLMCCVQAPEDDWLELYRK